MQEVPFACSQYLAGRFRADTELIANTRRKGSRSNNNALALAVTVRSCERKDNKRRKGEADRDICIIMVRGLHVVSTVIRTLVGIAMNCDAIKLSTSMHYVLIKWYEKGATNLSAILGYLHTLAILVCTHRNMQGVPCIPTACSVSGERVWLFDARMFLLPAARVLPIIIPHRDSSFTIRTRQQLYPHLLGLFRHCETNP